MSKPKLGKLRDILLGLKRVAIAYSGGLDSTFLLKAAVDVLGSGNVVAVTARSETYPRSEYEGAKRLARSIGARHITIYTKELAIRNFKANPPDRCYYCKRELFKKLDGIRRRLGFAYVLDGTNLDDLKDVRFGRKAAAEIGIRSPILEAGMTKSDIRQLSRRMNLPTWDKPSFACLASRIPFNTAITTEKLAKVGRAEESLRRIGFKQVRVRLHGDIARLEFDKSDFKKVFSEKTRARMIKDLKRLGFRYVALDLEGYRTGSMNIRLR